MWPKLWQSGNNSRQELTVISLWRNPLVAKISHLEAAFSVFLVPSVFVCWGLGATGQHVTKKEPSSWHCYIVHCYATTCEPPSCIRSLPRSGDFKCANSKVERPRWQTASCEKVEKRIRRRWGPKSLAESAWEASFSFSSLQNQVNELNILVLSHELDVVLVRESLLVWSGLQSNY